METEKKQGNIGVTTENIFPVIKKFLYSDHEIFLRELVSNAIDATQKLKTLSSFGEFKGELGDLKVTVKVDKEAGTLTVTDRGIGMTADDVEKYINQIAFSGAEEFVNKYKDTANGIIGHFGLGFYSAFMVSTKVEIRTLSYKESAQAVRWECDGSPVYTLEPCEKSDRGTEIILYIDDESKEFLDQQRINTLLRKYCRFLPIPVETDGNVINSTEPTWAKKPADLTNEDYLNFYHELYPGQDDPLFWIHLNVDYPFNLTGILYFPKIHNNFEITKNRIQLYCNQVFVTDSVEGVVPEFMMLLQGVIDSPDIPLNVSRSYLQSDSAVKKISGYITKKVSQRLEEIFKSDRKDFEAKWDDIKIFIEYGMLTDEKFRDAAMKFCLLKDTEGYYYTFDEYNTLIEATQTDSDKNLIYLYTTDPTAQFTYINDATAKGYNVLVMDGQLDSHFVGMLESKFEGSRFVRVDSDIIDNLIRKGEKKSTDLTGSQLEMMTSLFKTQIPAVDKAEFMVQFEALAGSNMPVTITQNEFMRRMKEMAAMQPGMNFYGQLPDSYTLVVNTESTPVAKIKEEAIKTIGADVDKQYAELTEAENQLKTVREQVKDNKPTDEQQKQISELQAKIEESRKAVAAKAEEFAKSQPVVRQVIDLALLSSGLLKGRELSEFINRSVSLL
ncbi:MAG: molecular chaperone HtpG [Bacteroides sp.]|nr:molecular chaperone HtpG [Bacteroides sp.]MCM1379734.1 molecular chaperone HtpG [Bacteroides sp.]MCM1445725.1 molecular chaperone HtpG [Prevotella sp.]